MSRTSSVGKKTSRKSPAKPQPTRAAGAQFKVACVLLAAGDDGLHHDSIAAKLDGVATRVVSNALFNMKSAGRAERPNDTRRWRLTAQGRDWATGGVNLRNQRTAGPARRTVATIAADVHLVPVRPSFRCWVASDGTFAMEKSGQHIELELEEARQMLRYLDMVGEELIAAAHQAPRPDSHIPGEPNEQRH
jgi:hypothetical protein